MLAADIYIIALGELTLSTTLPSNDIKTGNLKGYLCKKSAGDIVNRAQTNMDAKRKVSNAKLQHFIEDVTMSAEVDTTMMCADTELFENFLAENPALRPEIEAITKSLIADLLHKLPFLTGTKASQISMLGAMCRYEAVAAKSRVFNEGDLGDKLYIILSGKCNVTANRRVDIQKGRQEDERNFRQRASLHKTTNGELFADVSKMAPGSPRVVPALPGATIPDSPDADHVLLAELQNGDYFGETALMVNIPRTTTVTTVDKVLFVTIVKHDFHNFLKICPHISQGMDKVMKDRMIQKLGSMDIPFFKGIDPEVFSDLAMNVEMHEFNRDECVFREGSVGERFFIIVHGEVRIEAMQESEDPSPRSSDKAAVSNKADKARINRSKSISMDIGHLGPGKYFGEMALVSDQPRMATIMCNSHVILMSLGKEVFHKFFDHNPRALVEFQLRLLQGKSELKHLLAHPSGLKAFTDFLKIELADENIIFWNAVQAYVIAPNEDNATRLYTDYISEKATLQVNIPGKMRQEILKNLEAATASGGFPTSLFEPAEKEIYKLMVRDNYARFKKSPQFKEFFSSLGIFIDV